MNNKKIRRITSNENILFKTTDPYGRKVICEKDYYFEHICNKKKGREYLSDSEEIKEFIRTIEHPNESFGYARDRDYSNRIVYMTKHKSNEFYNRVVVEYENESFEGVGVVKTALQPSNVREGDKPLWLEETN